MTVVTGDCSQKASETFLNKIVNSQKSLPFQISYEYAVAKVNQFDKSQILKIWSMHEGPTT